MYWPYGAQRSGLDVEVGFLLDAFGRGQSPDVRLFIEAGKHAAGRILHGQLTFLESGRRTRYYEDLSEYGCPIVEWGSYESLLGYLAQHS